MNFGPRAKVPKVNREIEADYIHANQSSLVRFGDIFLQDEANLSLSFSSFSLPNTPSFFGSPGIDKIALAFPLKKETFLKISSKFQIFLPPLPS